MHSLVAAFLVMLIVMLALGLGLLAGRRPLRGSCAGREGACPCSPEKRLRCQQQGDKAG